MNLPNKLTIARVILVPVILLFLLPWPDLDVFSGWNRFLSDHGHLLALLFFIVAALTDLYDGKIARKRNLVTNFGKFLDPIADKFLVIAVMIALVQLGRLNALVPIIVILREFVVTGVRLMASEKGVVVAASSLGKIKTVTQIVALILILSEKTSTSILTPCLPANWIFLFSDLVMVVAVIMTLISGLDYLLKNISYFKD
ncbi:MAG: CDP-diacylglycerol--glycerol-3-phosphate 3-phosphatidyltransferase [Clostridiaceae bacterium]|mgnify:CR=1 FL=1|nr:CDP-diacylglycerol--glycerol-3-phosphate 3-phosphatidyltransferase [Clostridiaceae bacterium]